MGGVLQALTLPGTMEALETYLLDRETALRRILQKKPGSYTRSTFHVFRVEIKKLNALFGLADSCNKGFKRRRTFSPFRLIFRQAGKVRALQIEESILKKLAADQPLTGFIRNIRMRRLEEQRIFHRLLKVMPPGRLDEAYAAIRPLLSGIDEKQAEKYLMNSSGKIKKAVKNLDYSEIQIHNLRKILKSHNYLLDSLQKKSQPDGQEKKPDLGNLLGKWHDSILAANHLESALSEGHADPAEGEWLRHAKTTITAELEILTEKIRAAIAVSEYVESDEIERIN